MSEAPNAEQSTYWDGEAGLHWVAEAERYDALNGRFGERVVEALDPQPGERVLDVGCGNGALSVAIAERVGPGGTVLGIDLSGPMLEVARRRAGEQSRDNAHFERGDAQVDPLPEASFDAVTSRFGVMFFDDAVAAFANLARATKPDGRVAFCCWQDVMLNEWLMVPATAALEHVPFPDLGQPGAPGPFTFADADRLRGVLDGAGWTGVEVADTHEPMWLGSSVEDVVKFMRGTDLAATLLDGVPEETAAKAWSAMEGAVGARMGPDGLVLSGRAWIVTAQRG
jgi:SAM-dependent methyltransferase